MSKLNLLFHGISRMASRLLMTGMLILPLSASQISTSHNFTLAVRPDGTVWSWGQNTYGQLGDGTTVDRNVPAIIPGLNDVIAVSAKGRGYSLALKSDGTVWSWGRNTLGTLGDGTTISRLIPQQVAGISNVKQISNSDRHVIALKSDGSIWGWGSRTSGTFGDGSSSGVYLSPTHLDSWGNNNLQVSVVPTNTYILKSNGTVWGCGLNGRYQLGVERMNGDPLYRLDPFQIPSIMDAISISAGGSNELSVFCFAIRADRTVVGWGSTMSVIYPFGYAASAAAPTPIPGVSEAESISAGMGGAVVRTTSGEIIGWGWCVDGSLGIGYTTAYTTSAPVSCYSFGSDVASVSMGGNSMFAIKSNGDVYASGRNFYGELGVGNNTFYYEAVKVLIDGMGEEQISAGSTHSMAVKPDGQLWAWGDASSGRLGIGPIVNFYEPDPVHISDLSAVRRISTRSFQESVAHCLAVTNEGGVWAWGNNDYDQTGHSGIPTWFPVLEDPQHIFYDGIVEISAGTSSTIALDNTGEVWGWGFNGLSALALPTLSYPNTYPPTALGITGIKEISAGRQHVLTLKSDGTVLAWGKNSEGQVGTGTISTSEATPVTVSGLDDVISVSSGIFYSVALKSDGTVWTWGDNRVNQLGRVSSGWYSATPEQVDISNVIAISTGTNRALALKSDGTVWELGSMYSEEPVQVSISGVKKISMGGDHGLAVKSDGTFWAWGSNGSGQLGTGTVDLGSNTPVQVNPF